MLDFERTKKANILKMQFFKRKEIGGEDKKNETFAVRTCFSIKIKSKKIYLGGGGKWVWFELNIMLSYEEESKIQIRNVTLHFKIIFLHRHCSWMYSLFLHFL